MNQYQAEIIKFPLLKHTKHNLKILKANFSPTGASLVFVSALLAALSMMPLADNLRNLDDKVFLPFYFLVWVCPPLIVTAPIFILVAPYLFGLLVSSAVPKTRTSRIIEVIVCMVFCITVSTHLIMMYIVAQEN